MKKTLLLLTLFVGLHLVASAQNEIIVGTFGGGPSVSYKKANANTALRVNLSVGISSTKYDVGTTQKSTTSSFSPSIGYELRQDLGDKFILFYGADIQVSSDNKKLTYTTGYSLISSKTVSSAINLIPLVGGNYYFSKKMFLVAEARFSMLGYSKNKNSEIVTSTSQERVTADNNSLFLGVSPSYRIGLGFSF